MCYNKALKINDSKCKLVLNAKFEFYLCILSLFCGVTASVISWLVSEILCKKTCEIHRIFPNSCCCFATENKKSPFLMDTVK